MDVVDTEKSAWFLLKDGDDYYLDVNSGQSFVGYAICFQLNDQEIADYHRQGKASVSQLAVTVNDIQTPYLTRGKALAGGVRQAIHEAILDWNAN